MNWDDLKVFLDVSRRPKLEEAAAQTHLDATTLSRRIKRLEQELGVTLFERTRRGHVLTAAGEKLAARVEAMETASLDIIADSTSEQSAEGRIRLGVTEGLGLTIIAPAMGHFKQLHPKIDIDLIALSGFVSVPKRQADMSILLARPSTGRLKVRKLTDYSLHLYAASSYVDGHSPITNRDDLQNHTLVGYVDDLIYSAQLHYFDEVLPGLTPSLCSPSILAQYEIVKSGAGVGILPAFMAERSASLVRLLPDDINVQRSFWLAVHEDVAGLTRNRLLTDFLANLLTNLP